MAEPTIQFGVSRTPFGAPTGWVPKGPTRSIKKSRANVLNGIGNEVASKLYDTITEVQQDFEPASASVAPTVPPTIGILLDEVILTGISLTTSSTAFVSMTLTGHQHANNAHADTLQQAAHGVTLSKSFGAIDFFGGTAGDNAAVESSSLEITVQHVDVVNADGDHLVGENYDGRKSGSVTWHGTPTSGTDGTWDVTDTSDPEENTGFIKTTYTAEKAITLA